MKSAMERIALGETRGDRSPQRRGGIAALGLLLIIYMGSGAPAWALQILEASDHAELTAEISDSDVNRIALDGDRVSRVIQSPGGYTVEHDAVRGDLYLYPDAAAVFAPAPDNRSAPAGAPAPVTLYLGTEQGFTYRLSLTVVSRDSAQILIRNAAVAAKPVDRVRTVGGDRRGELVSLILGVARREPVAGYVIVPAVEPVMSTERGSLLELWRGPRFTARVLSTSAGNVDDMKGAEQLARLYGAPVAAAWVSAPGHGPNGERIAVLVEDNGRTEPVR
ncbi:TraK domain-containing protein [Candidatus Rariloculus sp.]|uniref:TraK domain-containing protein n=1 Tax=Candidatus Rariloculus sp. TaxID=3101265 RepID=UPI003D12040B